MLLAEVDDDIKALVGDGMKVFGVFKAFGLFEIEGTEFEGDVANVFLQKASGEQFKPFGIVFNGENRVHPLGKEEGGAAGAIFANGHIGLEEILEEINGGV